MPFFVAMTGFRRVAARCSNSVSLDGLRALASHSAARSHREVALNALELLRRVASGGRPILFPDVDSEHAPEALSALRRSSSIDCCCGNFVTASQAVILFRIQQALKSSQKLAS